MVKEVTVDSKKIELSSPPTGMQVIVREFKKDKLAMFSLISLVIVIIGVFILGMVY